MVDICWVVCWIWWIYARYGDEMLWNWYSSCRRQLQLGCKFRESLNIWNERFYSLALILDWKFQRFRKGFRNSEKLLEIYEGKPSCTRRQKHTDYAIARERDTPNASGTGMCAWFRDRRQTKDDRRLNVETQIWRHRDDTEMQRYQMMEDWRAERRPNSMRWRGRRGKDTKETRKMKEQGQ